MLKLKLQYFCHLIRRVDSLEKTLMLGGLRAGGEGDDRGWDSWMASLTWWTWVWVNSGSLWWTGKPGMLQSIGLQRVGHDWATELNWKMMGYPEVKFWSQTWDKGWGRLSRGTSPEEVLFWQRTEVLSRSSLWEEKSRKHLCLFLVEDSALASRVSTRCIWEENLADSVSKK